MTVEIQARPIKRNRPINREAERITGRDYISHTQLGVMRACPRKFAYLYVENARPDFQPSSLLFGGAFHAAIEFHFQARMEGLMTTPEALLTVFHDSWRSQRELAGEDVPLRFNKHESIDKLDALAERMIAAFHAAPAACPKGNVLGVEEQLRAVLDLKLPDVLAQVDLVYQDDDALHVVDFKTSRSKWDEQKVQQAAEQLLIYGHTVKPLAVCLDLPVRLHFVIVTKAASPCVQDFDVPLDEQRLGVLRDGTLQVWQSMRSGNFYPSPSAQNCTACPFKSRCPIFAGR